MGSSQSEPESKENQPHTHSIPPATQTAENIHSIPVTIPMSNYLISMISKAQQLFNASANTDQIPNYSKTIQKRLENFDKIQQKICETKYHNLWEVLNDIHSVWKSMYALTPEQIGQQKQHDPNSDFITFAAAIESEFYTLWDQFEQLLIEQNYLKKSAALSSTKRTKTMENKNSTNMSNTNNNNMPIPPQHQGPNAFNIGDICYRRNEKCIIQNIDFDTVTVALVSDPKREINTEFQLISKQPIQRTDLTQDSDDTDMVHGLHDWLSNVVGLPQYYETFASNGFENMTFVIDIITMNDLIEMGINKIGHRRKILHYAQTPDNSYKKRKLEHNMNEVDNPPPNKRRRTVD